MVMADLKSGINSRDGMLVASLSVLQSALQEKGKRLAVVMC